MNSTDCCGFRSDGPFLDSVKGWKTRSGQATYLIVCDRLIHRLQGASDILYIGQTKILGGSNTSRLWIYNNPTKNTGDAWIKELVGRLAADSTQVAFLICPEPPAGQTVKDYETQLLRRYKEDHWELPPLSHSHGMRDGKKP